MSNTSTYIGFSAIDYTGVDSLSSYALSLTPLNFIVYDTELGSHTKVVWDFGDGTVSKSISASKYYDFPGVYEVNLIVYDCNNNAMISSETKTITIHDFLEFTFNIEVNGYLITEDGLYILDEYGTPISVEISEIDFECCTIDGPLSFSAYYPPYQTASNIYYSVNGSNSDNYWNLSPNKFNHLKKFHTLYDKTYNYAISSYQYVETSSIEIEPTKVYAKILNGAIVLCESTDVGAFFVGLSGSKDVYYRDDALADKVVIDFWFDKTNNQISTLSNNTVKYINNLGISLSATIVDNPANSLSITSNGIDGEGYPIDSFNIDPVKFYNTNIPFVVKVKDPTTFSVKNFDPIELEDITMLVLSSGVALDTSYYTISSLNYTLSALDTGGYFRGYVTFPNLGIYDKMDALTLSAYTTVISDQLSSYTLSGESTQFSVYIKNYYDAWVVNEDFNPQQTLMDLRFQETLLEKPALFEDFLGSLLGNENSDHNAIGIKIYEKIANFVQNTQDLDYCGQDFLNSLASFVEYNDVGEELYKYPDSIKRIMDLSSLDKSKLIGELNKFKENLDIKSQASKTEYGINIGDQIDTTTYMVSAGTDIVALEKFSNTYQVLNSYQPISAIGLSVYELSAYSSDWGWPLVLPTTFDFGDIKKYYLFFEYNPQYDNTAIGGLIDFTNSKTTIMDTVNNIDLYGENGIFNTMFMDTLYQSLSLT